MTKAFAYDAFQVLRAKGHLTDNGQVVELAVIDKPCTPSEIASIHIEFRGIGATLIIAHLNVSPLNNSVVSVGSLITLQFTQSFHVVQCFPVSSKQSELKVFERRMIWDAKDAPCMDNETIRSSERKDLDMLKSCS